MAKRTRATQPGVVKLTAREAEAVVIKNHGVYTERSIDGQHPAAGKVVAKLRTAYGEVLSHRQLTALERVTALQNRLRTIIRFAIVPDGADMPRQWTTIRADIGEGSQGYACYGERTAGIREASEVLQLVDDLLRADPSERDTRMFLAGIEAGRLLEKMERILPVEPLVVSGRKAKVERPRVMREARVIQAKQQRLENKRLAEEALALANKESLPTDKKTTIKKRAARKANTTVSTLNRWLKLRK